MRVGTDREGRGNTLADIDDRPPFGKSRSELVVLRESLPQAVESLGDGLAWEPGERLGTDVHLDARNDTVAVQVLGERCAVPCLLSDRLVVEDDAADVLGG